MSRLVVLTIVQVPQELFAAPVIDNPLALPSALIARILRTNRPPSMLISAGRLLGQVNNARLKVVKSQAGMRR
jgi:hypothetical protein